MLGPLFLVLYNTNSFTVDLMNIIYDMIKIQLNNVKCKRLHYLHINGNAVSLLETLMELYSFKSLSDESYTWLARYIEPSFEEGGRYRLLIKVSFGMGSIIS